MYRILRSGWYRVTMLSRNSGSCNTFIKKNIPTHLKTLSTCILNHLKKKNWIPLKWPFLIWGRSKAIFFPNGSIAIVKQCMQFVWSFGGEMCFELSENIHCMSLYWEMLRLCLLLNIEIHIFFEISLSNPPLIMLCHTFQECKLYTKNENQDWIFQSAHKNTCWTGKTNSGNT